MMREGVLIKSQAWIVRLKCRKIVVAAENSESESVFQFRESGIQSNAANMSNGHH